MQLTSVNAEVVDVAANATEGAPSAEYFEFVQQIFGNLSLSTSKWTKKDSKVLNGDPLTLDSFVAAIRDNRVSNIVVMTGAGISVAAGIPDFRTPGTGLYDNLQKYNLPFPEAIFQLDYFRQRPEAFYTLAKEMLPGSFQPTRTHFFIALLAAKGLLLRNYTQNIDTLERVAGVSPDLLVEAHGSFGSAHCIACKAEASVDAVRRACLVNEVCRCEHCSGLVKPDIVFFGEALPKRYFELSKRDFAKADMLIVMGTSLQVQPFASLIRDVDDQCLRLLINRERVGDNAGLPTAGSFVFDGEYAYRDVCVLGDVQERIDELATKLGWSDELNALERQWKEKRGKAVDDEAKDAEVEEPQADKLVSQSATTADTASAGTAAATSTTPPPAAPRPSQ